MNVFGELIFLEVFTDGSEAAVVFNYFFSLVSHFGLIALIIGAIAKVISRS